MRESLERSRKPPSCSGDSAVKVCTVVGFPLGATLPEVKAFEAQQSMERGAQEIDMVINIGALKSGLLDAVEADIRGVVGATHRGGGICKVILETALLTREEKVQASLAAKDAGADFVKTSTGFSTAGATPEDVRLIRETIGTGTGIKAAGGVRTLEDLLKMVEAGATRIGASAGVKIVEQARSGKASAGCALTAESIDESIVSRRSRGKRQFSPVIIVICIEYGWSILCGQLFLGGG